MKIPDYISFIEYQDDFVPLGDGLWESGNWRVGRSRIPTFIGKTILFHKNQAAPSHFGGTIVDAYPHGPHWVFRFRPTPESEGLVCPVTWGQSRRYWSKGDTA